MTYWTISVQLDGNPLPLELCRCLSPEAVGEIMCVLARGHGVRPATVTRTDIPEVDGRQPVDGVTVHADEMRRVLARWRADRDVPMSWALDLDDVLTRWETIAPPF